MSYRIIPLLLWLLDDVLMLDFEERELDDVLKLLELLELLELELDWLDMDEAEEAEDWLLTLWLLRLDELRLELLVLRLDMLLSPLSALPLLTSSVPDQLASMSISASMA